MTLAIFSYGERAVERYEHPPMNVDMLIQWRQRLVIVAPSESIWVAYAGSIGWKLHDQHGENHVITRGSHLLELPFRDPFVLVLGLPYDTDFRLAVIGALHEMTPLWEANGGTVAYLPQYVPPAGLSHAIARAERAERYEINKRAER